MKDRPLFLVDNATLPGVSEIDYLLNNRRQAQCSLGEPYLKRRPSHLGHIRKRLLVLPPLGRSPSAFAENI
jgi:hypothetical protein